MTRRYADPVADAAEVRRRDDAPEQFLWRGRLYLVRSVLASWVESGRWWRSGPGRGPGPGPGLGPGLGPDDGERELWRVEAAAGRASGTGVYDLCFDWSGGGWTVTRVLD